MAKRTLTIPMKPDLLDRLQAEVERLQRDVPGVGWTRVGVIRMALERYLADENRPGVAA